MFDSFASRRQSLTAKALTISGIGVGVGFGSCGLGALTGAKGISLFLIYAGLILFFVSLASLAIITLIALGMRIAELFRK